MTASRSELEVLDETTCWELLRSHPHRLGRLAFVDEGRVTVLPVNYRVDDLGVVFRSEVDTVLASLPDGTSVGFEVDQVDPTWREGWSVLLEGALETLDGDDREAAAQSGLEVWAPGERSCYRRVRVERISGRRIR